MAGVLLRSGSLKQFLPLGATGNPVHSAASQLLAAIRRQLGQEAAEYFAVPVQDEKGQNIDWYSAFDGDVVPWTSATPEERIPARASLLAARERLLEKSRAMQASEDSEQQVFGRLLALATRIPGDDHVYLVSGRPVMTFWGFAERGAASDRDVLGSLDAGGISGGRPAAPAEIPLPPPSTGRWWRWLWWLLPLALLLGLLLFGLRACGPELGLSGFLREESLPSPVPPQGETADLEAANRDETPAPEPTESPAGGASHEDVAVEDTTSRTERYRREQANVDRSGTVAETAHVGENQETTTNIGNQDASSVESQATEASTGENGAAQDVEPDAGDGEMAGTESVGEETAPQDKNAAEPGTGEKPSDAAVPPPGAEDETQAGQTAPASPAKGAPAGENLPKAPGIPLTIPKEAAQRGSTEFLNGQWHSVTGLQDSSGNPVQLEYDFKGKEGMARLKRSVGGKEMECTAPVTSSFSGSKLVIDQAGDIRCPDGSSIQRSKVECTTDPQGHAVCKGKNPDGSDYNVRITKK